MLIPNLRTRLSGHAFYLKITFNHFLTSMNFQGKKKYYFMEKYHPEDQRPNKKLLILDSIKMNLRALFMIEVWGVFPQSPHEPETHN